MEKNFEEALNELEILVKQLENKDINLEDAIEKYNQALELSKMCFDKLNAAKLVVKMNTDGKEVDFDGESEN